MAQDPAQPDGIFVVQPVEGLFACTINAAVAALVPRLEKLGAEHGCRGQRDQQRDSDGHRQCDGELAEELAHDAAHQQNGNEDGDQRCAHREHGEADLPGALHGRVEGRVSHFEVAGDIFDHHDGVVHHEAGGNSERHQREVVDGVAEQVHHAECTHQRERHGHGRDDGGPHLAQEEEDHQHHQQHADHERNFHIAHTGANGGGAIHGYVYLDGGRDGGLQVRHLGHHVVHGRNDVGAGALKDNDQHRALELRWGPLVFFDARDAGGVDVGDAVGNRAQIGDAHRRAGLLVIAGNDRRVVAGLEYLVVVADLPAMVRVLESAFGPVGVGARQRRAHSLQADAVRAQLHRVQFDAHSGAGAAADKDLAHAIDLRDLLRQDGIGHVIDLRLGHHVRG